MVQVHNLGVFPVPNFASKSSGGSNVKETILTTSVLCQLYPLLNRSTAVHRLDTSELDYTTLYTT